MSKYLKEINFILLLSLLTIFSSCKGQHNSKNQKVAENSKVIGKIATHLDLTIWNIYQDKQANFWYGSKDQGIYFYDGAHLKQFTRQDGLVGNQIRGIQEDSMGNIFIETMSGVSKFDGQRFKTLAIKEGGYLPNEWKLDPSDLWFRIGFDNKGPYRYDGEGLHFLELPKSPQEGNFYSQRVNSNFEPYGIYAIYTDRKGHIWFGTTALGFCRFDGKSFSWHYEEQLQTTPSGGDFGSRSILEDKDEFFWFNNSQFKYKISPNKTANLDFKKEDGIGYLNENNALEFPFFLSIAEDNDGDLWMATYGNGVWRYNGKDFKQYQIKDGETDVLLFTIYKDQQGILWLGTHNAGVYKFNGKSFEKFIP